MENWLKCTITPGQFPGELGVDGKQHDGTPFSFFAPKTAVRYDREPEGNKTVPGSVKVEVTDRRGDLILVRLPRQTFQGGLFVTVKENQLEDPLPKARKATAG
ncbi:MAG TPA: hypothetical protein VIL46_12670 [Gemmataceae bacterium]